MIGKVIVIQIILIVLSQQISSFTIIDPSTWRSYNGSNHNLKNPAHGMAYTGFKRITKEYEYTSNEPSARKISDRLFNVLVLGNRKKSERITNLHTYWGHSLVFDTQHFGLNKSRPWPITVPKCDFYFDIDCEGDKKLGFHRTNREEDGTIMNEFTHYIDGEGIYGATEERNRALRVGVNGLLRLTEDQYATKYDPSKGTFYLEDPYAKWLNSSRLYFTGSPKANENPGVHVVELTWMREHNRRATELKEKNPTWNDEQLFQEARKWVIALIQKVTYYEYLPPLLGEPLPPYKGYNESEDARVSIFFSTVAFRYGHSEVRNTFSRLDENGAVITEGNLLTLAAFFNPDIFFPKKNGYEAVMRGLVRDEQEAVDTVYIPALRSKLFGFIGQHHGHDLGALDIQRPRDQGVPRYNDMREHFNLGRISTFEELTQDEIILRELKALYATVDDIDVMVGALIEKPIAPATIGPLFVEGLKDQFMRLRDGDRFFFENEELYGKEFVQEVMSDGKFSAVIKRVSNVGSFVQEKAFLGINVIENVDFNATLGGLYTFSTRLRDDYYLYWSVDKRDIHICIQVKTTGWVGLGFNPVPGKLMLNADIIIGFVNDTTGEVVAYDAYSPATAGIPIPDTQLGGTNNIHSVHGYQKEGTTTISFSKSLIDLDEFDTKIEFGENEVIFAFGDSDTFGYHGANQGRRNINLFPKSSSEWDILEIVGIVMSVFGSVSSLGCIMIAIISKFILKSNTANLIGNVIMFSGMLVGSVSIFYTSFYQRTWMSCQADMIMLLSAHLLFHLGCTILIQYPLVTLLEKFSDIKLQNRLRSSENPGKEESPIPPSPHSSHGRSFKHMNFSTLESENSIEVVSTQKNKLLRIPKFVWKISIISFVLIALLGGHSLILTFWSVNAPITKDLNNYCVFSSSTEHFMYGYFGLFVVIVFFQTINWLTSLLLSNQRNTIIYVFSIMSCFVMTLIMFMAFIASESATLVTFIRIIIIYGFILSISFTLFRKYIIAFRQRQQFKNAPVSMTKSDYCTFVFTDIENSTFLWQATGAAMAEVIEMHNAIIRYLIKSYGGYEVKTQGDSFMIAFKSVVNAVMFSVSLQRSMMDCEWNSEISNFYPYKTAEEEEKNPTQSIFDALKGFDTEENKQSFLSKRDQHSRSQVKLRLPNGKRNVIWGGLRVRVGIHTGTPKCFYDTIARRFDYLGNDVNKAARIESTAMGGLTHISKRSLALFRQKAHEEDLSQCSVATYGAVSLKGIDENVMIYVLLPHELMDRCFIERVAAPHETSSTQNNNSFRNLLTGSPRSKGGGSALFPPALAPQNPSPRTPDPEDHPPMKISAIFENPDDYVKLSTPQISSSTSSTPEEDSNQQVEEKQISNNDSPREKDSQNVHNDEIQEFLD